MNNFLTFKSSRMTDTETNLPMEEENEEEVQFFNSFWYNKVSTIVFLC